MNSTTRTSSSITFLQLRGHSPHFYLAVSGFAAAVLSAALNVWAYYDEGMFLTHLAFGAVAFTTAMLFFTFFWGFFLVMGGTVPGHRIRYVVFHAVLGSLSPLLFVLSISAELPTLSSQPIGDLEVYLGVVCVLVLIVQIVSGWSVLDRRPWRALTRRRAR